MSGFKQTYDLGQLDWHVSGWTPFHWRFSQGMETGATSVADVPPVKAFVPGSVQMALKEAGILPDWNVGLNARECEWVENRHWIFEAEVPAEWLTEGRTLRLACQGLDYSGWVLVNGKEVGAFRNSMVPHSFDLTEELTPERNRLQIVFDCPPRWLGQFGYTSQMTEWKPRFYYTWDWEPRLVQTGIWDAVTLEASDGGELRSVRCRAMVDATDSTGAVIVQVEAQGTEAKSVRAMLERNGETLRSATVEIAAGRAGLEWSKVPVELWWPNGEGERPLYTVRVTLLDEKRQALDETTRRVGFKEVRWDACEGAPAGADPWLCVVNQRPLFLQGVNWVPIRPNFADVTREMYRERLELYRDLGCNILRVWGGAVLEHEWFYALCDELGLLVWQEFPLSSSGLDNWPPEDETAIEEMAAIARSYIARRQHHASLLVWCGGNELQGGLDGSKEGMGKPVDTAHPLIAPLAEVVAEEDPGRRFLPTSSSGPRFYAGEEDYGKGLHWDVHGPWQPPADLAEWERYWANDDSLFRSETGSPGASPEAIIREYAGNLDPMPGTLDNPLWRRTSWWIEWPTFVAEKGREPESLAEYVAWSQERQARALEIAVGACRKRFPRCGGVILWMGHDSFPCAANTSVVDFHGKPKPAARALKTD